MLISGIILQKPKNPGPENSNELWLTEIRQLDGKFQPSSIL